LEEIRQRFLEQWKKVVQGLRGVEPDRRRTTNLAKASSATCAATWLFPRLRRPGAERARPGLFYLGL
jgi:hypothetical protein